MVDDTPRISSYPTALPTGEESPSPPIDPNLDHNTPLSPGRQSYEFIALSIALDSLDRPFPSDANKMNLGRESVGKKGEWKSVNRPASKSAYLEDDAYAPRVGKWVTLPLQRVSSRIRTQMPREITFRPPHVFVTSDPTRFVAANFLGPNFRTNPSYAILFFFSSFFLFLTNNRSIAFRFPSYRKEIIISHPIFPVARILNSDLTWRQIWIFERSIFFLEKNANRRNYNA